MQIRDILDFNRLTTEQVFYLGSIEQKYKIANVEIITLTGQIGVLNELSIYNSKKLYVALEMDVKGQINLFDENNINYNSSYQNGSEYISAWTGNLTDTLIANTKSIYISSYTIRNIIFSRLDPIDNVNKFIGIRITLV